MDICKICHIECLHITAITDNFCFLCDGKCVHIVLDICDSIPKEILVEQLSAELPVKSQENSPVELPAESQENSPAELPVELLVESQENSPYNRLNKFVREIEENGIKQGTPEWLESRMGRVGGSSVSIFMNGYNPFKSKYSFVLESLGIKKFISDIKPQWGNLFEDVFCSFVETDKKCKIIGADMFYPDNDGLFAYSPDGLGVIGDKVVLFEFKCPYSRTPNGKIPSYYTPQVLMGLDMIKVADYGLYAEAVIRRCSILDLQFNSVRDMSLIDTPKKGIDKPLAVGMIMFYCDELGKTTALNEFVADIARIYEEFSCDNDLGILEPQYFIKLMHLFNDKCIKVKYGRNIHDPKLLNKSIKEDLEEFRCCNTTIIGILPYKIFRVDYHVVNRQDGFLNDIRDEVRRVLAIVKEADKLSSQSQQMKFVYEAFNKDKKKLTCDEEEEEEIV